MKVTLARDVELGKCQEMSGIIHVVGEKGETHDRPLCNQGAIKFAVGKNPTTLKFPATGDVSQIEVKGVGAVCSKCLKVMQSEEAARRAPVEAPATKKPDPPPVINAVEKIAELKADYLAGKIDFAAYSKKAHFWDHAAREAGLLGAPLVSDEEPVRATGEPDEVYNARVIEWRERHEGGAKTPPRRRRSMRS